MDDVRRLVAQIASARTNAALLRAVPVRTDAIAEQIAVYDAVDRGAWRELRAVVTAACERNEPAQVSPGQVQPVVNRLLDPDVLRGIIARNTMQRLSADDGNVRMYVTAQDIKDSIAIAAEMRQATEERCK